MKNDETKIQLNYEVKELRNRITKLEQVTLVQKRLEEAVQVSEMRYRRLFETAQDGILILNAETGQIDDVNPFLIKILGYPREELIGKQLWELGVFKDRGLSSIAFAELQKKEYIRYEDLPLETKDGHQIEVEFISNVYLVDHKKVIQCNIRENTEHNRAELELKRSYKKLRRTLEETVNSLASALETRDPYTAGHERRDALLACAIAKEIGLDENRIEGLRIASLIHDIGKLAVPVEILSKPTKLTALEYGLIKVHPEVGYNILKDVEFPWPVAQIVYQHQERIDGSGYPQGLKGDEILLEARILAVADVVEAMASHRPYRPALGIDKALEEIKKNKGILYDVKVADTCLKLFAEQKFKFD